MYVYVCNYNITYIHVLSSYAHDVRVCAELSHTIMHACKVRVKDRWYARKPAVRSNAVRDDYNADTIESRRERV